MIEKILSLILLITEILLIILYYKVRRKFIVKSKKCDNDFKEIGEILGELKIECDQKNYIQSKKVIIAYKKIIEKIINRRGEI